MSQISAKILEQPQHLVRQPGHQQQHEQRFNFLDQNGILTMAAKSPDRHWKTAYYKMSGQLKRLESEQAELPKTFHGHLADVTGHLSQKKTVFAERAYQCFFETYDDLKKRRQQQRQLLKPKYLDSLDNDTKRILEEKSFAMGSWKNALSRRHWKFPQRSPRLSERHHATLHNVTSQECESFYRDAAKLEEQLGSEHFTDSRKQALCSKLEQSVTKLDSSHAAIIQIVKSDLATDWLKSLTGSKDYHRGLLKQYQQTDESGNQTSLVPSTSAGDKKPKGDCNWYRKLSDRKRRRERGGIFQAFCYTRKQKTTKYR